MMRFDEFRVAYLDYRAKAHASEERGAAAIMAHAYYLLSRDDIERGKALKFIEQVEATLC